MKKHFVFMGCFILFVTIFFLACSNDNTKNTDPKIVQSPEESNPADAYLTGEKQKEQEIAENEVLDWPEITENGVDEELFLKNLDTDALETIAAELQGLVEEMTKEEQENPEIALSEGFIRAFDSEQYHKVLEMGDSAMKPLYWIIYKSSNAGLYEYICAMALYNLSGYDFSNEDGSLSWANSKEFVERFNEKILTGQK